MFSKIDKLIEKVKSLRPLTQGEIERLRDEFLVEYTYNSNAIEGNTLTLHETALILKEGITIAERPIKDHLEAIGHKDAYYYIEDLVKKNTTLSEKVIKNIHSLVLMDKPLDKGVYRSLAVRIMGAAHIPPEPYKIQPLMEQLMEEYNEMFDTMHPIERVAKFHIKFEGIHPFIDGNGRTGRLLMNLDLMKEGFLPINIKFENRRKYYDCFGDYYQTGNSDMLINLVKEYEEEALERYINAVEG